MIFFRIWRLASGILFYMNLLCLLIAVSAPYVNPKEFWLPSLFGLFFKIFIFIHVLLLILFIGSRNWQRVIIGSIAFIISLPALSSTVAMHPFYKPEKTDSSISIMTYNVQSFNWYMDTAKVRSIIRTIEKEKPDVICLQEYYMHPKYHKRTLNTLSNKLGYKYYYEYVTDMLPRNNRVGQAIFSKRPFTHFTAIPFSSTANGAFYVDLRIAGDTVRLFNVHFQSISLSSAEYELPSADELNDQKVRFVGMGIRKLRNAFRRRSYQANLVKQQIEDSPYETVLCGDFNDSPVSYLYRRMTEDLNDAYLETNAGIGSTYAGNIPFQRIDYVLTSPEIFALQTKVIRTKASDHYPLVCRLRVPEKSVH